MDPDLEIPSRILGSYVEAFTTFIRHLSIKNDLKEKMTS